MATRLQKIANKVDTLKKLMGGDDKELPRQKQSRRVLGISRLRRA